MLQCVSVCVCRCAIVVNVIQFATAFLEVDVFLRLATIDGGNQS